MEKKAYFVNLNQEQKSRVFDLLLEAYEPAEAGKRLESLIWTCERNPHAHPEDTRYFVLEERDKISAYSCRMPAKIMFEGNIEDCYFAHETLVHPKTREKGMGIELNKEVVQKSKSLCVGLWANERLLSILIKMGWKEIAELHPLRKIISFSGILKKALILLRISKIIPLIDRLYVPLFPEKKDSISPDIDIFEIGRFGLEMAADLNSLCKEFTIITWRDINWLNWKYVDIPYKQYKIFGVVKNNQLKGYAVLRVEKLEKSLMRKGLIVDLLCHPEEKECFLSLIKASEKYFKQNHCDYIVGFFTYPLFLQWMKQLHYSDSRSPVREHFLLCNIDKIDHPDIVTSNNNWFLTFGDSDYDMLTGDLRIKMKR
jgi:hypothetical protein